jgi:hypothetical protein
MSAGAGGYGQLPDVVTINGAEYVRAAGPDRVSIHGMYDSHLFTRYDGATPEEVVQAWRAECESPDDRYGPPDLCPVCVLSRGKELRVVGPMIHYNYATRKPGDPAAWLSAVNADPDIRRLLAEGKGAKP